MTPPDPSPAVDGAGLRLRDAEVADLPVLAELARLSHQALTGRPHPMTLERLRTLWDAPGRDPGSEMPVVVRDGGVVAFADVIAREPLSQVLVLVTVDPSLPDDEHAATAELLLGRARQLGRERAAGRVPGPELVAEVLRDDERLARACRAAGLRAERQEHEMVVELAGVLPEADLPHGLEARAIRVPEDVEQVADMLAEAFSEHPGDLPFSAEMLDFVLGSGGLNAEASALVSDSEGAVGVLIARDRPDHGYVWVLGVRPRGRRRGLGEALLARAFRAFAAQGTTTVSLDVEAENSTGAVRVYERAGMRVRTVHDLWVGPLSP